jgi:hypothetical protein
MTINLTTLAGISLLVTLYSSVAVSPVFAQFSEPGPDGQNRSGWQEESYTGQYPGDVQQGAVPFQYQGQEQFQQNQQYYQPQEQYQNPQTGAYYGQQQPDYGAMQGQESPADNQGYQQSPIAGEVQKGDSKLGFIGKALGSLAPAAAMVGGAYLLNRGGNSSPFGYPAGNQYGYGQAYGDPNQSYFGNVSPYGYGNVSPYGYGNPYGSGQYSPYGGNQYPGGSYPYPGTSSPFVSPSSLLSSPFGLW